ncbi:MAG: hypothetical protein V3T31_10395, partial [candidate division Zixibacteria bacterium]
DGELTDKEKAQFELALKDSADLQAEYEAALALKKLLENHNAPDPGEEYFDEMTSLVMAKTKGAVGDSKTEIDPVLVAQEQRSQFVRSLVSAAASLFLFFTALYLGPDLLTGSKAQSPSGEKAILTASVASELHDNYYGTITVHEQENISGAMYLLSPPGTIGRFIGGVDISPW